MAVLRTLHPFGKEVSETNNHLVFHHDIIFSHISQNRGSNETLSADVLSASYNSCTSGVEERL